MKNLDYSYMKLLYKISWKEISKKTALILILLLSAVSTIPLIFVEIVVHSKSARFSHFVRQRELPTEFYTKKTR